MRVGAADRGSLAATGGATNPGTEQPSAQSAPLRPRGVSRANHEQSDEQDLKQRVTSHRNCSQRLNRHCQLVQPACLALGLLGLGTKQQNIDQAWRGLSKATIGRSNPAGPVLSVARLRQQWAWESCLIDPRGLTLSWVQYRARSIKPSKSAVGLDVFRAIHER